MTKEVLISIKGFHVLKSGEDVEPLETIAPGLYYERNGKTYIKYEEMIGDVPGFSRNTIKITGDVLEVRKQGDISVHMVFELGKKHVSCYQTPLGMMETGLITSDLDILRQEDRMDITIKYILELDGSYASDCFLTMKIQSKTAADFIRS